MVQKVILLSGYRGLAETLISHLTEKGHLLSVLVRRENVLAELSRKYPTAHFFLGDVNDQNACRNWVESTAKKYGRIDCLINNAAVTGPGGRTGDVPFTEIDLALKTNLIAPIFLCQLVLPHLESRGDGVIINLSGGGATYPRPNFIPYAISKAAIVRFTESLSLEYPNLNIYAISPGALSTPMMEAVVKMGREKIGKEFDEAKRRMEQGGEDPLKAAELIGWLFENRPKHLNGKLISAIWDDYKNSEPSPDSVGLWTLRRVDEVAWKSLREWKKV